MTQLAIHGVVLAAGSRLDGMRNRFSGRGAKLDTADIVVGVLVLLGIAAGIALLSYLVSRQDKRRGFNSPRALFRELCKAHGLARSSRRLLRQLARWQRLSHPARIFLEPERFDPANLSPRLRAQIDDVRQVRDQIFARPIEEKDGKGQKKKSAQRRSPSSDVVKKGDPKPAQGAPGSAKAEEAVTAAVSTESKTR